MIEKALQHTNCLAPFLIPGGRFMSWLYIPGESASGRETFDCKLNLRRLEEQRLRLRDLGTIAAYKLNAHARIDQSRARSDIERKGLT